MPVTIGQMTTEVIAEPDDPPTSGGGGKDEKKDGAAMRAKLAALARQVMRTRAEGFDD